MSGTEIRTIEDLAADLAKPLPEVLEVAKNFTTQPGRLFTEVPPRVENLVRAWYQED
ncbi:hypothetical protein [Streptomyces sp. NPDC052701]|uniref:hypothetical protein n=1 Tax=Streptomyces sp. NPDC052701 TaxID=3155533 RepID=UPI003448941F